MEAKEFLRKAKAENIIHMLGDSSEKRLVFEQKDNYTKKGVDSQGMSRVFNSLSEFISFDREDDETIPLSVIYDFEKNLLKSFYWLEGCYKNEREDSVIFHTMYFDSYVPIKTADYKYFVENKIEQNEKRFLKMIKPLCSDDTVKNIILTLQEGEISIKNERSPSDDVVKKILKNTYKNLPQEMKIVFKPYLLEEDFVVELDLFLDWSINEDGFKSVSWSLDVNDLKQAFLAYLKEKNFQFSIGSAEELTSEFYYTV